MMLNLNDEQEKAAYTEEIHLIEAEPGAGKTATLIERFKTMSINRHKEWRSFHILIQQ